MLVKKALFSALILLYLGQIRAVSDLETEDSEPILDSEEIVPQEEAALLRNFFTVNLSRNRKQKRPPPHSPNQPNVSERRKANNGQQRKRLNDLFVALSDPIGCKLEFFLSSYLVHFGTFLVI